MQPKQNAIAKIGKHVVSFGGSGEKVVLDALLTVKEAASLLRCSCSSLNKWRLTGNGPKFIYVGRRVRYRAADLSEFIASSTRLSTSDRGGTASAA